MVVERDEGEAACREALEEAGVKGAINVRNSSISNPPYKPSMDSH